VISLTTIDMPNPPAAVEPPAPAQADAYSGKHWMPSDRTAIQHRQLQHPVQPGAAAPPPLV
jgi:hypothetical protein